MCSSASLQLENVLCLFMVRNMMPSASLQLETECLSLFTVRHTSLFLSHVKKLYKYLTPHHFWGGARGQERRATIPPLKEHTQKRRLNSCCSDLKLLCGSLPMSSDNKHHITWKSSLTLKPLRGKAIHCSKLRCMSSRTAPYHLVWEAPCYTRWELIQNLTLGQYRQFGSVEISYLSIPDWGIPRCVLTHIKAYLDKKWEKLLQNYFSIKWISYHTKLVRYQYGTWYGDCRPCFNGLLKNATHMMSSPLCCHFKIILN